MWPGGPPTESTAPTDPIERTDPVDPMHKTEPRDRYDQDAAVIIHRGLSLLRDHSPLLTGGRHNSDQRQRQLDGSAGRPGQLIQPGSISSGKAVIQ